MLAFSRPPPPPFTPAEDTQLSNDDLTFAAAAADDADGRDGGFNLADYVTTSTPEDRERKTLLFVFSVLMLFYPILCLGGYLWWTGALPSPGDELTFLVGGGVVAAIIIGVGVGISLTTQWNVLQPAHERWAAAVEKIGNARKKTACDGVRDTLYHFRHLLKWRRFMQLLSPPFRFGYWLFLILSAAWAVIVFFKPPLPAELSALEQTRLPIAASIFGYYVGAFLIRYMLRTNLLRFTDGIDPTQQICVAMAELHDRWETATSGGGGVRRR